MGAPREYAVVIVESPVVVVVVVVAAGVYAGTTTVSYIFVINHLFIITRRSAGPPDTRLRIMTIIIKIKNKKLSVYGRTPALHVDGFLFYFFYYYHRCPAGRVRVLKTRRKFRTARRRRAQRARDRSVSCAVRRARY